MLNLHYPEHVEGMLRCGVGRAVPGRCPILPENKEAPALGAAEEDLPCVSCGRAISLCAQESVSKYVWL